jgi:hypothetical protein
MGKTPKTLRREGRHLRGLAFGMKERGNGDYAFLFYAAKRTMQIARWLESGCICTSPICDCYCRASEEVRKKAFDEFERQLYQEWYDIKTATTIFCRKHGIPVQ